MISKTDLFNLTLPVIILAVLLAGCSHFPSPNGNSAQPKSEAPTGDSAVTVQLYSTDLFTFVAEHKDESKYLAVYLDQGVFELNPEEVIPGCFVLTGTETPKAVRIGDQCVLAGNP